MTVRMRLREIQIRTDDHDYSFDLSSSCTVLEGPVGTGKSSLLELIKYSLGGNGVLTPTVRSNVRSVELSLALGGERMRLRRNVGVGSETVDLLDPVDGDFISALSLRPRLNQDTVSDRLLETAGLPNVRIPRSRTRSTGANVPLSFNDVYSYVYVEQQGIDRSVVHHTESFREPKRRAVFELMFGLSTADRLRLETELGRVKDELKTATSRHQSIRAFLGAARVPQRIDLEADVERWTREAEQALVSLEALRQDVLARTDAHEHIRAEVAQRESTLREIGQAVSEARAEVDRREQLVAQMHMDFIREDKVTTASRRLSPLEFVTCPRCMQDIDDDRSDHLHCTLCLQSLPPADSSALEVDSDFGPRSFTDEQARLLVEARQDLAVRSELQAEAEIALRQMQATLNEATAGTVSPRFEEIELLSARRASALERVNGARQSLTFWLELAQLDDAVAELTGQKRALEAQLQEETDRLQSRSTVLDDLSEQFNETVKELNVPWAERGRIDPQTYLPLINDGRFEDLAVAGGTKTVVTVAYHLTLLGYSLAQAGTLLPSLLILDTPRKNLGSNANDREMGDRIYRRIRALVDLYGDRVQFVIADNDIPTERGWFNRLHFDYDRPLLEHVAHPGEEAARAGLLELVGSDPRDSGSE